MLDIVLFQKEKDGVVQQSIEMGSDCSSFVGWIEILLVIAAAVFFLVYCTVGKEDRNLVSFSSCYFMLCRGSQFGFTSGDLLDSCFVFPELRGSSANACECVCVV